MRYGLAIATLIGLVASGCTGTTVEPPPDEVAVAVTDVGSLDPLMDAAADPSGPEALVLEQVLEGLTTYDPETLEVRPALAASWDVSPDARAFTFLLREDVTFHDGRPFTSDDVVYTLNRLARTGCVPTTSPLAGAPAYLLSSVVGFEAVARTCSADRLAGVVAENPTTVRVALSEPSADLPAILGHPALRVVPEDDPERPGGAGVSPEEPGGAGVSPEEPGGAGVSPEEPGFERAPVGTGPYRITDPWDGSQVRLEAFEEGRSETPDIGRIRFVGYGRESLGYLDFLGGETQYSPVPVNRAREARRESSGRGSVSLTGLSFFGVNLRSPRMQPLGFRQGLALAVDREAIASAIFDGSRDPARGLASRAFPGVEDGACPDLCSFDLEAARRAISAAYPEGAPEITIGVSSEGSNPAVGDAVARMFERAGVQTRVVERPFADHVRGLGAGDVDVFGFGWFPAYPALEALLRPLFASEAGDNYMGFADPEVDRLLTEGRAILDPEARTDTYRDAERRILEQVPVIPIGWYRSNVVLDPRLEAHDGVLVDGRGLTRFADLGWSSE